jgi:putative colanic acid biosynthesis acetyltransferase WcaF
VVGLYGGRVKGTEVPPLPTRLERVAIPSIWNKLGRLAWSITQATLFRWSPVPMHGLRCSLLRLFGARISRSVHIYPTSVIWAPWNLEMAKGSCLGPRVICYSVARVKLGSGALVSQGAHLCSATHDHRDPAFPLVTGVIEIGDGAWVAAEAFIGPGVCVGPRAVIGARAVAMRDVAAGLVAVGNPAQIVGERNQRPSS